MIATTFSVASLFLSSLQLSYAKDNHFQILWSVDGRNDPTLSFNQDPSCQTNDCSCQASLRNPAVGDEDQNNFQCKDDCYEGTAYSYQEVYLTDSEAPAIRIDSSTSLPCQYVASSPTSYYMTNVDSDAQTVLMSWDANGSFLSFLTSDYQELYPFCNEDNVLALDTNNNFTSSDWVACAGQLYISY